VQYWEVTISHIPINVVSIHALPLCRVVEASSLDTMLDHRCVLRFLTFFNLLLEVVGWHLDAQLSQQLGAKQYFSSNSVIAFQHMKFNCMPCNRGHTLQVHPHRASDHASDFTLLAIRHNQEGGHSGLLGGETLHALPQRCLIQRGWHDVHLL
jgi:hypothetical protein